MNNVVHLDGSTLTLEHVHTVAHGTPGTPTVALTADAEQRVARAAAAVQTLLERGEVAYGITTGFGAFKERLVPLAQVAQLQHNILMSHAVGVGPALSRAEVRALMLIRANTLAHGYSGIRPATLQLLLDLLNRGVHPVIPEQGSLGASGDLAPLAHMGLPLIGLGQAEYGGEVMDAALALQRAGLAPATLAAKEGLALTNGTAFMAGLGVLSVIRAERLAFHADIAGALCVEALRGTPLAFDARIHALRPFPNQIAVAARLRQLLAGSTCVRPHDPHDIQDAYTLRCIPQVHGAVRDMIAYARQTFAVELNAVTDNPLIFINADDSIEVISGGNFHGEPLAFALDSLAIALCDLGNLSERRIMRLLDASSNKGVLPPFLAVNGGLHSGLMLVQYTAAALASENKILAHPASTDTIPTSANVEDHVSMGATAAVKLRRILENVEQIVGLELFTAAQAVDFRLEGASGAMLGRGTAAAYRHIRQHIPFIAADTMLTPHFAAMQRICNDGSLARAVDEGWGDGNADDADDAG